MCSTSTRQPAPWNASSTTISYHAELAASVPNSKHVVLAGAGHAVQFERPAEVAAAINEMLAYVLKRP